MFFDSATEHAQSQEVMDSYVTSVMDSYGQLCNITRTTGTYVSAKLNPTVNFHMVFRPRFDVNVSSLNKSENLSVDFSV